MLIVVIIDTGKIQTMQNFQVVLYGEGCYT